MDLRAPEATPLNLPDLLLSDAFFPANASRTYGSRESPITAGQEKYYARFPSEEPCPSPDGKFRWQFLRYEPDPRVTFTRPVLDLENSLHESLIEIMLRGPTIRILWAKNGAFTAITNWEDDEIMRVDLVNTRERWTRPLTVDRFELAKFFASEEIEGKWSMKAYAWTTDSVLIVRAVRVTPKASLKLCGAEFAVDVSNRDLNASCHLRRAFVCDRQ
jgi:hypothetical protein